MTEPERDQPVRERILGCLLAGALGDALGGITERGRSCLSDDTQLTLATCESIVTAGGVDPAHLAATFTRWFEGRRFVGLGSATLKALRDLQSGAHWALAGARGEMAAGNGGAMRIAPLAFLTADRTVVRDVVRITHHSDEAYVGALAVIECMRMQWPSTLSEMLADVSRRLPDTRVRDRLQALADIAGYSDRLTPLAAPGASGYVVDTVPLALAAAWHMVDRSFEPILEELIAIGGDTDTIASIAGQVAGARTGIEALSSTLVSLVPERQLIEDLGNRFADYIESTA